MSRTGFLLLGLLGWPAVVGAQASEALLKHRVEVLNARYLSAQRALALRDSEATARQDLVPLGGPPIRFLVPRWVAPNVAAPVAAIVDSWAVRTGPLFLLAPAETLTSGFYTDTAGRTPAELALLRESFPLEVTARVRRAVEWRVQRALGERLVYWEGHAVPLFPFDRGRREAVIALAKDTTGVGMRCLAGDVTACLAALADEHDAMAPVRRSLLAGVLEDAGPAGWSALAADTSGVPEGRIAAAGGAAYPDLVARWIARLRTQREGAPGEIAVVLLTTFAWTVAVGLFFLWRLTWHRA